MALIKPENITKIEKNSRIQKPTDCTYNVFTSSETKYIQLETYGSANRETTPKPSQTIQFDKNTAEYLMKIFIEEFNISL